MVVIPLQSNGSVSRRRRLASIGVFVVGGVVAAFLWNQELAVGAVLAAIVTLMAATAVQLTGREDLKP